ncbi:stress protein [Nonomuraea cavernae]|uniref:Stress protein n=1 Tax=Nonomuraea cavernae TaxID=2045107 RepID=A0A917ZC88_9ACTN|nr:stress protein [Nonomuraea cavernae]MCA2187207.1 hypothetical protein [Nonomuraea cavernae]GGO78931.1 hypothetical protein GCM10012289_62050 [Nonomuraea cavernae]
MGETDLAVRLASAGIEEFLRIEREAGHDAAFAQLDVLTANLMLMALSGRTLVSMTPGGPGRSSSDIVSMTFLTPQDRSFVDDTFALETQQRKGAWFLPEEARLKAGTLNLPAYARHHPGQSLTLAQSDSIRTQLSSTADALLVWSLLIPLFDTLMAPVVLRAAGSEQTADVQRATWATVLESYSSLGIARTPEVEMFTYGGGWGRLDRAGQAHARTLLLDALSRHDLFSIAARFRATRLRALIGAIIAKTRSTTPPARRVLNKTLKPTLSAYFGGDWLACLDYLGLPPNPGEELVTALPTPKLYVGGASNADATAAEHGVGVGEVEAMLAAFLNQATAVSPVEQRVDVLRRWWGEFDSVHSRQESGMKPLWGLVEDVGYSVGYGHRPDYRLYRTLLTPNLVEEINLLWDGTTLPRWPEAVVSEPYPHRLMADTFGPAVSFWHGVALTTWYVCEGPSSRTTLSGLRAYHEGHLAKLAEIGTPIHSSLFAELEQAESRLGPIEELPTYENWFQRDEGVALRMTGGGSRRDGFSVLRDILTRHRRGWTSRYLDEYLHHRWHTELTAVARELNKTIAASGKSPTFKRFARFAAKAANHWFNGDLSGLYTAIGEKAPSTPPRVDLLPITAHDFVDALYAELGGQPYEELLRVTDFPLADVYRQKSRLASAGVTFVQMSEALGRAPDPKEFGVSRYEWSWAGGVDQGWPIYQTAIEAILHRHQ